MIEPLFSDDALLADIAARERVHGACDLWWLGQSGYLLQHDGRRVLIDPYLSDSLTKKYAGTKTPHVRISRRVIDPSRLPRIDVLSSSHNHTDHLDADTILPVVKDSPEVRIVVPAANVDFAAERLKLPPERLTPASEREVLSIDGVEIRTIPSAHDRIDRDENANPRCVGYVYRVGNHTIYHSGDTVVFDGMVELLKPLHLDVAILPINGLLGNMDGIAAAELARAVSAGVAIPCHYDLFEFNTASPRVFEDRTRAIGQPTRVLRLGERFTLG